MLVFGHAGLPAVVFPTSQGRFYEFEDRGMVDAIRWKIDNGEVQLFCVDSVDAESWYNRNVGPRWRIARQVQYDEYIIHEVVPLIKQLNWSPKRAAIGCSFGGYHAVTMALRHPDVFTAFLSMSGRSIWTVFLAATTTRMSITTSRRTFCRRCRTRGFWIATGKYLRARDGRA